MTIQDTFDSFRQNLAARILAGDALEELVPLYDAASRVAGGISGGSGTGATFETGNNVVTGSFVAIQFLSDTIFADLQSNWDGDTVAGQVFPTGMVVYGLFSQFQLSSGAVIAYKG